jgi:hypothetical protein
MARTLAVVAVIALSLGVAFPGAAGDPARQLCPEPATILPTDPGKGLVYQKDWLKLDRARQQATIEGAAAALPILDELTKDSTYEDILAQASRLRTELAQRAVEERDAKRSWLAQIDDALHSPWLAQFVAVLLFVIAVWFGLRWIRDAWRWIESHLTDRWRQRPWTFAGVRGDDALGARDPILDAIRRVPHEVRQPVWTPTRLLMYPGSSGWEVWEDFGVGDSERPKPVHEELFRMDQWDQGNDKALADAFQNLQFNFGAVGFGTVMKFWSGLVDWWQAGQPSLCATCMEVDPGQGAGKLVAIRLNATGASHGTVSVLASTPRESGIDSVSLSAERAAYKLLFRMKKNQDTAAQIDGHAAFRQGVANVSRCVRSVIDKPEDKSRRETDLKKAICNLEFVREIFGGDPHHTTYFLESLRFLGVCYALIERDVAARRLFEDLEDAAEQRAKEESRTADAEAEPSKAQAARARAARALQLATEARYNQAILYWKSLFGSNGQMGAASAMADKMFADVARDRTLEAAAAVWQLAQLGSLSRREWLSFDRDEVQRRLKEAAELRNSLDKSADGASGSARRQYTLLAAHARRYIALAQLRFVATFDLPARGPFSGDGDGLTRCVLERVQSAFDCLTKSEQIGPLCTHAIVARAYGLLLLAKWFDAEEAAAKAIAADSADQFARYVAAEAAFQRKDVAAARKYVEGLQPSAVIDPALRDLLAQLSNRPITQLPNS